MDQAVARFAFLLAIVVLAAACATGRSQAQLGATAFGSLPTPSGSKLVSEWYDRPEWNVEGPNCAILHKMYASQDPAAFLTAFRDLATKTHAAPWGRIPEQPVFYDIRGGYAPGARVDVEGTTVSVDIHDTTDARWWPKGVDQRDWPFIIEMYIVDGYRGSGGDCSQ